MTERIPVRNPFSGEIDAHIEEPTDAWLASECARLRAGQQEWAARGVEHRIAALEKLAGHWRASDASCDERRQQRRVGPKRAAEANDTSRSGDHGPSAPPS